MGGPHRRGRAAAAVNRDVTAAYEGVADAWAAGPAQLYARLADAIAAEYPLPLAGQRVLDVGAGTGVMSVALQARGARTVGVDIAADMVAHMHARGFEAVTGDLLALPFDGGSFDGAVAAFSISHVDDPTAALAEARRVVRSGGVVMAGVFAEAAPNPAKDVVDAVASAYGFEPPEWYVYLKTQVEPLTATPDKLSGCAERAGLIDISVVDREVDSEVREPAAIVASRLGKAHLAPFVAGLPAERRERLLADALAAATANPQPLTGVVLILSSRVPA